MQKLGLDPGPLAKAAERAKAVGRPDAARDLADLVERTGRDFAADPLVDDKAYGQMPKGAYA
jgi:UDP-N-acetylglucosamine--N-acetylmuramyl-(pentapeptide) pyrophosphoryl-undecaprenol N-acetylglucosamine transferase